MPSGISTNLKHDTIAAPATPPGGGAVAIIRLSGPRSLDILKCIFHPANPAFQGFKPRFLHYGQITAPQNSPAAAPGRAVIDEALAVFMPGPGSFTGEDVVEIHCHGGPAISNAVLGATLEAGARLAEPGEFTRRAFLNGRLDLAQAEAVAECIAVGSEKAAAFALENLGGLLSARVRDLRDRLRALCAELTVAVDFPEEDVDILPEERLAGEIAAISKACAALASGYDRARLWRQGALVVLAGRVNVGKSSLLNALLGRERAIVTPHPGTTRDFLEESLNLDGLTARLVDTAGLRAPQDPVEEEGLRRTRELIREADLVLWVSDLNGANDEEARRADAKELNSISPRKIMAVLNKIDLSPAGAEIPKLPGQIPISARTGEGLEELAAAIRSNLLAEADDSGNAALGGEALPAPNLRQNQILCRALDELNGLTADLKAGTPYDLLGVRAEFICAILAEVTGEITTDDVLDMIFSQFCLGK